MADINVTQIGKFNGKNYQQWKFQIKCALRAKGILEVSNGTTVKPEAANADALQQWNKKDATAMFTLTSAMELCQITLIENCTSAKELMDKLDSIYEQKSETNKMIVQERFHEYRMDQNDSIAQHIAKVENLARKIKESGETISDIAIMTKILGSLPQKYRNVRQAWLSLDENKQTIHNLTARLLDEESNLTACEESEKAFSATTRNATKPKGNGKQKVTCYNCQKKGHFARECHAPRKEREKKKNSQDHSRQSHFTAFSIEQNVDEETALYTEDKQYVWTMDSGASAHMTYHKDFFATFQESDDETTVMLGNKQSLPVKGKGSVKIKKLLNNKWHESVITNVLYIPDLRRNLFSEGVLTRNGMKIIKENNHAYVYDDNKMVAQAVREQNNLYRMQFQTVISHEANAVNKTETLKLWHERLGHINIKSLRSMIAKGTIAGVDLSDSENFLCEACMYGKQHKLPFTTAHQKNVKPGELIYSDLCGPMTTPTINGARYMVLFKDGSSGYCVAFFIKHKTDALDCFKRFVNLTKNKFGHPVKIIHVDNGTEYVNDDFREFLHKSGIEMERTAPYTPEQNGRSEREMRTIVERARSLLYAKDLPTNLWGEAVNTAVYLLNRTPRSQAPNTTPFEIWTGKKPTLTHLKLFGCEAFAHTPKEKRTKLEPKSKKLIFVGYDANSTNYRLLDPETKRITISRNVTFNENNNVPTDKRNHTNVTLSWEEEDAVQNIEPHETDENDEQENFPSQHEDEPTSPERPDPEQNQRTRRNIKPPKRFEDFEVNIVETNVPQTYEEAMSCNDSKMWDESIKEELNALMKNKVWDVVPLPEGKRTIGTKWVFKVKRSPDGEISRFKSRLCAKGFAQKQGIDYKETFSPTTRYDTIRILLSIAAQRDYEIMQFDIKTAFLYGDLEEEIYLAPPNGTNIDPTHACKLNKSLYGLKQASRCWNQKFNEHVEKFGFKTCDADKCVYRAKIDNVMTFLILYVDDGLIMSENKATLNEVLRNLKEAFEITTSEPTYFVGLDIVRNRKERTIFIHQKNYIDQIIKRFNLEDAKPVSVPADPHTVLKSSTDTKTQTAVPYREAVGSLMFAAIVSRPDIMFAVGVASRFLENHDNGHWNAVKRIIRYLKNTAGHGIEYRGSADTPTLIGYSDSDYANDPDTRRSTSGYIFKMNNGAVTWCSQRQHSVSLSTTEAEYIAASNATKEIIWLRQLLKELGEQSEEPTDLHMDNQSAIRLVRNPEFHKRTKHIDVRYHFIREKHENNEINLKYVPTDSQQADIFTKPLARGRFEKLRSDIGMKELTNPAKIV